jgi:protein phosphatase PTC2/3
VYDGHGGSGCADYLRETLHLNIINSKYFPLNPVKAIKRGFLKTESKFLQMNTNPGVREYDKSGSCCLVSLIVDTTLYVANLGDSRALLFENDMMRELTEDHKPCNENERKRIVENGG